MLGYPLTLLYGAAILHRIAGTGVSEQAGSRTFFGPVSRASVGTVGPRQGPRSRTHLRQVFGCSPPQNLTRYKLVLVIMILPLNALFFHSGCIGETRHVHAVRREPAEECVGHG